MDGSPRILVTGAGGFVGTVLLNRLAQSPLTGAVVKTLTDLSAGGRAVDIAAAEAVDALVDAFRPTCVVHLAAISSLAEARQDARRAWEVNVLGTLNLAEAVLRHAPQARFIFASSSEVYGGSFNAVGGPVDETALLEPRNGYAVTKAAADLLLGQMAETGLRAVRFRPFNHTGPGQTIRFAVPAFASQIAAIERGEREPVLKVGNLDARRDFLDVRDVVDAYILAMLAPDLPAGIILNLASGLPRRIGDVLDALLMRSTAAIRIEHDEALMRPSDVPVTAGDSTRAREILGWRPTIDWATTLDDVLGACRARGT